MNRKKRDDEKCKAGNETGAGAPCEFTHWCHRWSSLRGTIRVRGVPKYAEGHHATPPVGAIGGAHSGARSV